MVFLRSYSKFRAKMEFEQGASRFNTHVAGRGDLEAGQSKAAKEMC